MDSEELDRLDGLDEDFYGTDMGSELGRQSTQNNVNYRSRSEVFERK